MLNSIYRCYSSRGYHLGIDRMTNTFACTEAPSPNTSSARQALARRNCTVCQHPERWRVELLKAGGASLDSLAQKFGLSRDAIYRHLARHVSAEMKGSYLLGPVQLQELAAKAADTGASVLDHLHAVRTVLMGHLATVTEAGDSRAAAHVAGRLTTLLEVIAKISGELGDLARSTTYNITNNVAVLQDHPAFAKVQASLLRALGPYPDARRAVVDALRELAAGKTPATLSRNPGPDVAAPNGHLLELAPVHVG
jgi:hypothetical protein